MSGGYHFQTKTLVPTDASYRTLGEQGYVLSRGKVITLSSAHSINLYNNNVKRYDFITPSPSASFTQINTTAILTEIPDVEKACYLVAPERNRYILRSTDGRQDLIFYRQSAAAQ